MGDLSETFKVMKEFSQNKRRSNREYSAKILKDAGVDFESFNNGAHLVIKAGIITIDFWPGTGKWEHRQVHHTNYRGVRSLLKYLRTMGVAK